MTKTHYALLLWTTCAVSWAAVWLPALVHLSMTWYRGRNRVFKQLCSHNILLYYRYFAPTEVPPDGADVARHFERQFARLYGRRRFVIPLTLLFVVSACGFCATARSVQVWEGTRVSLLGAAPEAVFSLPKVAVAAFLGAFSWVVTDQLQRLRNGDLTQHHVAICFLRFMVAIPFGYAFAALATESVAVPVAFLLGTFPTGSLMKAGQRLVSQRLQLGESDSGAALELESLQSVSRSNAERFLEEGVGTIAELANSDPVDLALRTNQPFDYVVDCCAQALVWIYFTDKIRLLSKYSLRSVYEVSWLVARLQSSEPQSRAQAEAAIDEASKVLEMSPDAVRNTLDRITETPFTQFLIGVGKQRSAMPIRHAQAPNEPPAESGPTLKAGDASDSNPGTTQATG